LRQAIVSGRVSAGDRMPTEMATAEQHGVAVLTVRQAHQVLIDEGLIRKEQGRGTFVNEGAAGSRRLLVVCGVTALDSLGFAQSVGPYHQNSVRFCLEAAAELGFEAETFWPYGEVFSDLEEVGREKLAGVCGAVFIACPGGNPLPDMARQMGLASVQLGRTKVGDGAIWFDLQEAARLAWDAVREEVERRDLTLVVASVEGEQIGSDTLAQLAPGKTLTTQISNLIPAWDTERHGYDAIRRLCDRMDDRIAVIFLDDVLARGGTRALLEAGLGDGRCPVAVVGGKQEVIPYGLPVTHITHDTEQEARWAVEMLAAQLEGRDGGTEPRQSEFVVEEEEVRVASARDEGSPSFASALTPRQESIGIDRQRQESTRLRASRSRRGMQESIGLNKTGAHQ
jgi:hypothetical protein